MKTRSTITLVITSVLCALALNSCHDSLDGKCSWCGGSGGTFDSNSGFWETCWHCNGSGEEKD